MGVENAVCVIVRDALVLPLALGGSNWLRLWDGLEVVDCVGVADGDGNVIVRIRL